MKNGIYTRSEMTVAIYQNGNEPEGTLVVITSDLHPNEPMVVTGKRAHDFALGLINQVGEFEEEES